MNEIIKSKTIETDYFGILAFITGFLAVIPWYYWIGKELKERGEQSLSRNATTLASLLLFIFFSSFFFIGAFGDNIAARISEWLFTLLTGVTLVLYFGWNENFRRCWNKIEKVSEGAELKAGPIWTILLGPLYLNFKINQAKGLEK